MLMLVYRVDFCNLENEIGNEIEYTDLGYVDTEVVNIQELLEDLTKKHGRKYKGWDKGEYPKFRAKEIVPLDLSKCQ